MNTTVEVIHALPLKREKEKIIIISGKAHAVFLCDVVTKKSHQQTLKNTMTPPYLVTLLLCLVTPAVTSSRCPESDVAFELSTGFVFTAPEHIMDTRYSNCQNLVFPRKLLREIEF